MKLPRSVGWRVGAARAGLRQRGLSLAELLVGMLIGLVVLAAAGAVYVQTLGQQADNLRLARLNQDLRAKTDLMTREIRRAGFVSVDPGQNLAALRNNPFFAADTDLVVHDAGTCLLFAYNRDDDPDGDGVSNEVPTQVDANERSGFRLVNGELRMRRSGADNAGCSLGSWESLTEPEIEVTALQFALSVVARLNPDSMRLDSDGDGCSDGDDDDPGSASALCAHGHFGNRLCDPGEGCNTCVSAQACLEVRSVSLQISARLRDDPGISQTITQVVRVRNDRYLPAWP